MGLLKRRGLKKHDITGPLEVKIICVTIVINYKLNSRKENPKPYWTDEGTNEAPLLWCELWTGLLQVCRSHLLSHSSYLAGVAVSLVYLSNCVYLSLLFVSFDYFWQKLGSWISTMLKFRRCPVAVAQRLLSLRWDLLVGLVYMRLLTVSIMSREGIGPLFSIV